VCVFTDTKEWKSVCADETKWKKECFKECVFLHTKKSERVCVCVSVCVSVIEWEGGRGTFVSLSTPSTFNRAAIEKNASKIRPYNRQT